MKLGEFLNNQASKLGLQQDPALIALLSNAEFANREIPDSFANPLDQGLMSFDSAKNNYGIKHHFSATILSGVDAKLLEDVDFDADTLAAISAEKNSYNKIALVKSALKSQIEKLKTGDPADKTKKEEIEKQIKELNNQVLTAKQAHEKAVNDMKSSHESELTSLIIANQLIGKSYANKDLTAEDNATFARSLIDAALKESGAIIARDGHSVKLKDAKDSSLDFYVDNKAMSFSDFSDKVLASKKMLAVTTPSGAAAPNTPAAPAHVNGAAKQNTANFAASIAASMSDLTQE